MSDWVPREAVAPARSPSRRIRRGFSRIGVAVALLIFIVGAAISYIFIAEDAFDANRDFDKWACVLRQNSDRKLTGDDFKRAALATSNCGYFSAYSNYGSLEWVARGQIVSVEGIMLARASRSKMWSDFLRWFGGALAICALLAGTAYFFFWGLGWVVSGFARDERTD
jgi:hypothetical protein